MYMRKLSESEIINYLKSNEWQGCVGSYQAENLGANLFYSNNKNDTSYDIHAIMGMPVIRVLESLRKFGVNPLQ